jgi:hypothetical protein
MKQKMLIFAALCLLTPAISNTQVFVAHGDNGFSLELTEIVNVAVNCTTAEVYTQSIVMCGNTSLVHFPSGVDMNQTALENATAIVLSFTTSQSFLIYVFYGVSSGTAESLANTVTPSIETAFETDFTWSSTGTSDSDVNVTYTGPGKTNLADYTEWLMQHCLASDLGGFSLTFAPMSQETNAVAMVSAFKDSGGFDWMYQMGTGYSTSIPAGTGNHKIDILDLLNVDSLAPSPYAITDDTCTSMVMLIINSNTTVTYVSCEPGSASPEQPKGWIIPPLPGTTLTAYFSFGDDPSSVSPLSFTFGGTIVPEFTLSTLMLLLMMATAVILAAKKKPKI